MKRDLFEEFVPVFFMMLTAPKLDAIDALAIGEPSSRPVNIDIESAYRGQKIPLISLCKRTQCE